MLAATGQLAAALARADALLPAQPTPQQLAGDQMLRLTLYAYAGRHDEARAAAREATRLCPEVGAHWSELAMQEARYGSIDAAREALAQAAPLERSAMAQRHEQLALALLALREDDGTLALVETAHVVEALVGGAHTTSGYLAFAFALHAAALAGAGHVADAKRFLAIALPRLGPNERDLVERAERAIADAERRGVETG